MNYILFDDPLTWENLLPLTFTRPVSELRTGILSITGKWEHSLNAKCSWLTKPYLQEKYPLQTASLNLLINSSVIPEPVLTSTVMELKEGSCLVKDDLLIACCLHENDLDSFPQGNPGSWKKIDFKWDLLRIKYLWDLFRLNGECITRDFHQLTVDRESCPLNPTNTLLVPEMIFAEEGVSMDCVTLNAKGGPVYLGRNTEIMEGTAIRGPFALCDHSTVKLNSKIYGPTTIGPWSKAGGEISNSVITGFSNKAHDGFLGNSVLGEWCNIGADSNNSNLKNNYTEVRVWSYPEEKFINTGLQFCGLFMGDHSKCGINTMFNTGTLAGVNVNIFGSGFPRNFIPSFSWGGPGGYKEYKLEKAFEVARAVMSRRGIEFNEVEQRILQAVYTSTAKYRT